METDITQRLEYIRGEIESERISWGELVELRTLVEYIDPSDVQLLEWAGVPEFHDPDCPMVNNEFNGTDVGCECEKGVIGQ